MPEPTRVFLVRHGATVLTAENRFAGSVEVPLADEGREQAQRLAMRLAASTCVIPSRSTASTASL